MAHQTLTLRGETAAYKENELIESLSNGTGLEKSPGTYYRSRVFTAQSGVNSLVAASQPILALIGRLQASEKCPDVDYLLNNLSHELRTFESRALESDESQDLILIAKYLLCATVDQCVAQAVWVSAWQGLKPLEKFYPNLEGKHHFFNVLKQTLHSPEKYIEILELSYLCLSLGFEHDYQDTQRGDVKINLVLEELYGAIRDSRGDKTHKLFSTSQKPKTKTKKRRLFSLWYIAAMTLGMLVVCYVGFNYMLAMDTKLLTPSELSELADISKDTNSSYLANEDL